MAASSSPMARMKARCGVRSRPSRVIDERRRILRESPWKFRVDLQSPLIPAQAGIQFSELPTGCPASRGMTAGEVRSRCQPTVGVRHRVDRSEIGLDVDERRVVEAIEFCTCRDRAITFTSSRRSSQSGSAAPAIATRRCRGLRHNGAAPAPRDRAAPGPSSRARRDACRSRPCRAPRA